MGAVVTYYPAISLWAVNLLSEIRSWPDFVNAAFVFIVACLWLRSTAQAWRDEEIKGMTGSLVSFYLAWSLYAVWLFFHLQSPVSGWLFAFLAVTQTIYLFSYWVFAGPINYDRRRDRARLWCMFRVRRIMSFGSAALEEIVDLPAFLPPDRVMSVLPIHNCRVCGTETRHDLDGHCMICDTKNGGEHGTTD